MACQDLTRRDSEMRPSFVGLPKPFLCSVITETTPDAAIRAIRTSEFDGAQAYLFDLLSLDRQYHNREDLESIFQTTGLPIMVYYYRKDDVGAKSVSDEVRAEAFLTSIQAGASAIDMMADFFDPTDLELTNDQTAIVRQRNLSDQI